ncbi:unnamed protein product [Cochlearia groenlandica]
MVKEQQNLDKQLGGCMAGFFNIFDRPHLLSPKRLSSPSLTLKNVESSPALDSRIHKQQSVYSTPELRSPATDQKQSRSPLTLPVMELKQGSPSRSPWRFSKEAPRLSLDSRVGSLKPRQIRNEGGGGSPSVIARLMGLEALPIAAEDPIPQQPLQRSVSESRFTRDYRFVDNFNFQNQHCNDKVSEQDPSEIQVMRSARTKPARAQSPHRFDVRRKILYDSADLFPECGYDDTPRDLETLKQLLEALRLKGLLHSSIKPEYKMGNRNMVFDHHQESPIKQARSASPNRDRSSGYVRDQSKGRSRIPTSVKNPNCRRRRVSPLPWKRPEPVLTATIDSQDEGEWKADGYNNRKGKTLLERCDKLLNSIAEMATAKVGESQPSPVSVLDASHYNDESCPSPVMKRSLDFTGSLSLLCLTLANSNYQTLNLCVFMIESEDESWGGSMVSVSPSSLDTEYVYISDILRAFDSLPQESNNIFSLLEKQQYHKGKCGSQEERRLIFDAVQEILLRRKRLPPWRVVDNKVEVIWSEYQKMRKERLSTTTTEEEEEGVVGYVYGLIGRDLKEDMWRDCEVEMSEAVLDIERLVFKDLIGETICCHLIQRYGPNTTMLRSRRLLF